MADALTATLDSAEPGTVGAATLRAQWRAAVLPHLTGDVLDVGAGAGASLAYLSAARTITLLEPHGPSARTLDRRTDPGRIRVVRAPAERLPMSPACFDVAICCTVLCSVRDPRRSLAQLRRVLRPGGLVVIFEHVAAERGTWLRAGQHAIAPLSRVFDRGCDPARDLDPVLRSSGLIIETLRRTTARGPLGIGVPFVAAVLRAAPGDPRSLDPKGRLA